MSSSTSSGGPDDGIIEITFPSYSYGPTGANGGSHTSSSSSTSTRVTSSYFYGPNPSASTEDEESLDAEVSAGRLQPGEILSIVCPLCEIPFMVEVTNRYMHPQTSPHKRDAIVATYINRICDCPDITVQQRSEGVQ